MRYINWKDFGSLLLEAAPGSKRAPQKRGQESTADQAARMKLRHLGRGKYGKKTGVVTHQAVNGKLTPVSQKNAASKVVAKKVQNPPIAKKPSRSTAKGPDYIKDKTLDQDVNPNKNAYFGGNLSLPPEEFFEKNKKHMFNKHPMRFSEDVKKAMTYGKSPRRYCDLIERIASMKGNDATKALSFYDIDIKGGAGVISAQAGELLYVVGMGMNDREFEGMISQLSDYVGNTKGTIIDQGWLNSVKTQRQSTLDRLKKQYGKFTIENTAWDVEEEVTALGLKGYKDNKGYSTDAYLRIKTEHGYVLDEVSLKKNAEVNLLNSGINEVYKLTGNKSLDQSSYSKSLNVLYTSFGSAHKSAINAMLRKPSAELAALIKSKMKKPVATYDEISAIKDSRSRNKIMRQIVKEFSTKNTTVGKNAQKVMKTLDTASKKFVKGAITTIANDPLVKQKILETIRESLPLKSVVSGEESIAINGYSFDKFTAKHIFGTDNFDDISERLKSLPGAPPFIAYQAEVNSEVIPIANMVIRENGTYYSGIFRFDMRLNKKFSERIKQAHKQLYGSPK